jgi:hypothetical protein
MINLIDCVTEYYVIFALTILIMLISVPTFFYIILKKRAPYGRYADENQSFGFNINGRLAWVIQESPVIFACITTLVVSYCLDMKTVFQLPNIIFISMIMLHYLHRTFIFPFRMINPSPTPFWIMMMAFLFCSVNGYIQTSVISRYYKGNINWLKDPRFIIGTSMFFIGMFINIYSDYYMIYKRKQLIQSKVSDIQGLITKKYFEPSGGFHSLLCISCPNYFGETIEWFGLAIAMWHITPLAFAIFTFANIGARGYNHHKWYHEKFPNYKQKNYKAVIPFIF